ncbi:preprotein translocase subunit YajC [Chlamydiota bacterium]
MTITILGMASAQGGQASPLGSMLPFFIIFFAIFYFLIIRPQQKKQKQFKEMLASLKEYDKVITTGGIYGTIVSVKDSSIVLKIADNVKVEVNKGNITHVVTDKQGVATSDKDKK